MGFQDLRTPKTELDKRNQQLQQYLQLNHIDGAVIVQNNKVIAKAGNQTIGDCDPTGHAEIVVMRKAAKILGNERLDDCDLYVTLEPCAMCAGAIAHARIRRLYYAAKDEKGGAVENGVKFFSNQTCQLIVPAP